MILLPKSRGKKALKTRAQWLRKSSLGVCILSGGGGTYEGTNVVWIVDTGIDLSHPDLNIAIPLGFNAINPKYSPNDDNGHGTHVAGIVGAIDNSVGVVGVAANAPVVPIKVLNSSGSGTVSDIIEGIDHIVAFAKPGDVVNMSLGGEGILSLDEAVLIASQRGLFFAIAAGNESSNSSNYSPARVNSKNIWTVSAHDANGALASFSNYGNPPVDVSAPGVKINSTFRGGKYNTQNGTSMAAPHLAGVLLLTAGKPTFSGTVKNDRDGQPDPMLLLQNQ
jgi:subtilisin family serine protease